MRDEKTVSNWLRTGLIQYGISGSNYVAHTFVVESVRIRYPWNKEGPVGAIKGRFSQRTLDPEV
jgi:hypothetical protein